MGTTVPGDITNLVQVGTVIDKAPATALVVGAIQATTCDVFVADANPDRHNLADVTLDLTDARAADRAVRWAASEHSVDLGRLRDRAALLTEQILRLAGEPDLPDVNIVKLPGMDASWAVWFPGGPAAPATYVLRTPAHCDAVTRWLGGQLGFPVGSTAPEWTWYNLSNTRQGWHLNGATYWASFEAAGLRRWDDASARLDAAYALDPKFATEIDPSRSMAIAALQAAIALNPSDPDVPDWESARDTLIGEI